MREKFKLTKFSYIFCALESLLSFHFYEMYFVSLSVIIFLQSSCLGGSVVW